MNLFRVGEAGVGEMGVGKMGQIIGETGVGEMEAGKTWVILCVRVLFGIQTELLSIAPYISFSFTRFMELYWDSYCPYCTVSWRSNSLQSILLKDMADEKGPVTIFSFLFLDEI